MSEPETPAPEQATADPNAPPAPAPELDVTQPVPPAEAPPLPADPNIPTPAAETAPTATPAAAAAAETAGVDLSTVEGTGVEGKILVGDVAAAVETSGATPAEVTVSEPVRDTSVLESLLEELRDLKAKIVAAIGA